MVVVLNVGAAFFPLDEELGLLGGSYTPQIQEAMSRLGAKMPYGQAKEEIERFCHTLVSEPTIRRQTMENGQAGEALAKAESKRVEKEGAEVLVSPNNILISADGAFIALTTGEWREVKTVSIGEFETVKKRDGSEKIETGALSYFSRSYQARDFEYYALSEVHRRGIEKANIVVSVNDGAEWIQNFMDYHVPEAVRILDFSHAQGYIADAGKVLYGEGTAQFQSWFRQTCHTLKHSSPEKTLTTLEQLRSQIDQQEALAVIDGSLAYLRKREPMLNYTDFVTQGYPIGSGCVESGHKVVVQSRMKQAGMRWAETNLDPMLALRNLICNDRWTEGWTQIVAYRQQQQREKYQQQYDTALHTPTPVSPAKPTEPISPPLLSKSTKPAKPTPKKPYRPPADHPWRKPFLPRRRSSSLNLT